MAKLLSKAQILAAGALATEDVAVPEWGGVVRVRAMSGAERDSFEAGIVRREGKHMQTNMQNIRARLVAATVVDDAGALLFTPADVATLGALSASALDRVFTVAQRLSGLSTEDVDELAGSFTPAQNGASTSA
jgi:hypothetical protein